MAVRNFSMQKYWEKIAENRCPILKFKGQSQTDWKQWSDEAYPKFVEILGEFPQVQ